MLVMKCETVKCGCRSGYSGPLGDLCGACEGSGYVEVERKVCAHCESVLVEENGKLVCYDCED